MGTCKKLQFAAVISMVAIYRADVVLGLVFLVMSLPIIAVQIIAVLGAFYVAEDVMQTLLHRKQKKLLTPHRIRLHNEGKVAFRIRR